MLGAGFPQRLKPDLLGSLDATLKGRSSTAVHAFVVFPYPWSRGRFRNLALSHKKAGLSGQYEVPTAQRLRALVRPKLQSRLSYFSDLAVTTWSRFYCGGRVV